MGNSKNSDNSSDKVKKNRKSNTTEKKETSKKYNRGEAQKPVNVKYRKNWDKIFINKN
tara:strand:+ start:85 stop:258 length:174 start_codon:yes stop_codon:yes gene_type:complete